MEEILRKLDELNVKLNDSKIPTKEFLSLVNQSNQLIGQLEKLAQEEKE